MSSEAAIRKGKGIIANPEFILAFGLSALFGVAGTVSVIASWLDYDPEHVFEGMNIGAIVMVAALTVILTVAGILEKKGHGAEALLIGLVAVLGILSGIVTIITLFLLWASPADGSWVGVHGFGMAPVGALIAVLLLVLAPSVIYGERILPIFVAFIAGVWGVLSVIVFVFVMIGAGE